MPAPGGWENTFFERRRKCELSEQNMKAFSDLCSFVVFCCSENTWNIGPYCIISQLSRKVFKINMQKYISPDSEKLGEFNGCCEKPIWAYKHDLLGQNVENIIFQKISTAMRESQNTVKKYVYIYRYVYIFWD